MYTFLLFYSVIWTEYLKYDDEKLFSAYFPYF